MSDPTCNLSTFGVRAIWALGRSLSLRESEMSILRPRFADAALLWMLLGDKSKDTRF